MSQISSYRAGSQNFIVHAGPQFLPSVQCLMPGPWKGGDPNQSRSLCPRLLPALPLANEVAVWSVLTNERLTATVQLLLGWCLLASIRYFIPATRSEQEVRSREPSSSPDTAPKHSSLTPGPPTPRTNTRYTGGLWYCDVCYKGLLPGISPMGTQYHFNVLFVCLCSAN